MSLFEWEPNITFGKWNSPVSIAECGGILLVARIAMVNPDLIEELAVILREDFNTVVPLDQLTSVGTSLVAYFRTLTELYNLSRTTSN